MKNSYCMSPKLVSYILQLFFWILIITFCNFFSYVQYNIVYISASFPPCAMQIMKGVFWLCFYTCIAFKKHIWIYMYIFVFLCIPTSNTILTCNFKSLKLENWKRWERYLSVSLVIYHTPVFWRIYQWVFTGRKNSDQHIQLLGEFLMIL